MFHKSTDEGNTWTEGVYVDPRFSLLRNGCAITLPDGRIVAPCYHWITPHFKDAEQDGVALSYSYYYYSDDEGDTWLCSVNDMFIKENEVAYDFVDNKFFRLTKDYREFLQQYHHLEKFGEPNVVELKDGRLLSFGRCRLGQDLPDAIPRQRGDMVGTDADGYQLVRLTGHPETHSKYRRLAADLEPGNARGN